METAIVVELGAARVRVGLAGSVAPLAVFPLGLPYLQDERWDGSREDEADLNNTERTRRAQSQLDVLSRAAAATVNVLAPHLPAHSIQHATSIASPHLSTPQIRSEQQQQTSGASGMLLTHQSQTRALFRLVVVTPALGFGVPGGTETFIHALRTRLRLASVAAPIITARSSLDSTSDAALNEDRLLLEVRQATSEACAAVPRLLLSRRGRKDVTAAEFTPCYSSDYDEEQHILVVDVGAHEGRALPVCFGRALPAVSELETPLASAHVGASALVRQVLAYLQKSPGIKLFPNRSDVPSAEAIRRSSCNAAWRAVAADIVERCCFCAPQGSKTDPNGPVLHYPLPPFLHGHAGSSGAGGSKLELSWDVRWQVVDQVLFGNVGADEESDGQVEDRTLTKVVLDALLAAPVDTRAPLARNILLCGGLARLPGLAPRLLLELQAVLSSITDGQDKYVPLRPLRGELAVSSKSSPQSRSDLAIRSPHLSWLGGAMLAALDEFWTARTFAMI